MPEQTLPLSLSIPSSPTTKSAKPISQAVPQTSILSAESLYSNEASTLDYTPSSPSFEFSDVLSPDAYNLDGPQLGGGQQAYQYLGPGQMKHSSKPNTPSKLQTAFAEQWLNDSPAGLMLFGGDFQTYRSKCQTLATPLSSTSSYAFPPYDQPFELITRPRQSSISLASNPSFHSPYTPASDDTNLAGAPPTPFTDLASKDAHHARMPSAAESLSSISSAASSVAGSVYDGLQDLPLPALINGRPPRFKPTPRQLSILLHTYERTKHVNAEERERLAKRLGDGVKPRHIQVWFQNRRSKSRNKERPATPSPADSRRSSRSGLSCRGSPIVSRAIRAPSLDATMLSLALQEPHSDLIYLPVSKLAIGDWSRLLSSSADASSPIPDLMGYASPSAQTLTWYLSHAACSFKLVYDLASITSVTSTDFSLETRISSTVSVAFHTAASPLCYALHSEGWMPVADFTDWRATRETVHMVWGQRPALGSALESLVTSSPSLANVCQIPRLTPVPQSDMGIRDSLMSFHFPQPSRALSTGDLSFAQGLSLFSPAHASTYTVPVVGHRRQRSASQPILTCPQPDILLSGEADWTPSPALYTDGSQTGVPSLAPSDLPPIDLSAMDIGSTTSGWDTTLEPTPTHTTPGYSPAVWSPSYAQR